MFGFQGQVFVNWYQTPHWNYGSQSVHIIEWHWTAMEMNKEMAIENEICTLVYYTPPPPPPPPPFPYLAQMITSMRGCVAYNDLWPWQIHSRSFGLGLENRVRSVVSTILDELFSYLVQMITSMRRCVTCDDLWPWPISSRSLGLDLENRVRSVASTVMDGFFPYLVQMITSMRRYVACDDLWHWPRSFDLVLTWDPTWLNSVGNHEAVGGILRTQAF